MSHDLSCHYAIKLWLIWQCDWSTLTLVVLKIENRKINQNKNENEKINKINQVQLSRSWQVREVQKSKYVMNLDPLS